MCDQWARRTGAPLREFAILTGGILLVCAIVIAALALSADCLTRYIPFRYEQALFDGRHTILPEAHEFDQHLKSLADRIAHAMDLHNEMKITVHYADLDEVNAYATFGGHVVINRGLIEKLPNENALAMVMAHEIAYIKHRHPSCAPF